MKNDTAIEILKIAVSLTEIALANKAGSKSQKAGATPQADLVFTDCVNAAEQSYKNLTKSD